MGDIHLSTQYEKRLSVTKLSSAFILFKIRQLLWLSCFSVLRILPLFWSTLDLLLWSLRSPISPTVVFLQNDVISITFHVFYWITMESKWSKVAKTNKFVNFGDFFQYSYHEC